MNKLIIGLLTSVGLSLPAVQIADMSSARDDNEATIKSMAVEIKRDLEDEGHDQFKLYLYLVAGNMHAETMLLDDAIVRYEGGEAKFEESEPLLRTLKSHFKVK